MATSVTLPALGESVTEGTVTRWLKQPGDQVAVDEALLEVSTDKVDTEIPSPVAGTLLEIKADEDETIEVGAELCTIGDEGESSGSGDSDTGQEGGDDSDTAQEDQAQDEEPAAEQTSQEASGGSAEPEPEPQASGGSGGSGGSGDGSGTSVTLPELGESVTEGTVTRWLKQVGDEVAVDEALLEVSTDKVDTEIPSPVAGTLLEIKADEDETVEVGGELAVIGSGQPGGSGGGSGDSDGGKAAAPQAEDAGTATSSDADAPEAASQEPTPDPTPPASEQRQPAVDPAGEGRARVDVRGRSPRRPAGAGPERGADPGPAALRVGPTQWRVV